MREKETLYTLLNKFDINLDKKQVDKLIYYMNAVLLENSKLNLTAITDKDEFILKHIIDSIVMINSKHITTGTSMIDIGTGAGFPGIPLKIVYPEINLVLVDSVEKKLKFISKTIDSMGIEAKLVHERAEKLGQDPNYREKHDIVISRAVAQLQVLGELCLPLVKIDGIMITSKGPKYHEEINIAHEAIEKLGGDADNLVIKNIDLCEIERYIINVRKISPTPKKYPRKPGVPNKNPL